VITATDKLGGRGGKQLLESAVKKYAVSKGIPVLQPKNLKAPEFTAKLRSYQADLQIIVAFRMLPEVVWNMPPLGTFNLHGSLLPRYRGAAPINWAVIRGEKQTGVTTFFLQHEIDTGNIIMQNVLPIGPNDTAGDVHDRMMVLGAETVLKTVQLIEANQVETRCQEDELATSAPKLKAENTKIDFHQTSQDVHNFIRGLSPYPTAWALLEGKKWKLLKSAPERVTHDYKPGQIVSDAKSYFKVATADGFVEILELQMPGKRRMPTQDFLNGWRGSEVELGFE
ncbi:MAG: methionyl-tRNA formyltransferase, partial [Bacteroidota bacterium]